MQVRMAALYELNAGERLEICWQIACGMAHIAGHPFVHGALTSYVYGGR